MLDKEVKWNGVWFSAMWTFFAAALFLALTALINLTARVSVLEAQLEVTAEKVIELHCLWGGESESECSDPSTQTEGETG